MSVRSFGLIVLLLLPAAVVFVIADASLARCVAIGTFIAFMMGVSSRPVAVFAFLAPVLYAAAAITSGFTDGVAALIVAVAAAAGAGSSQGYHRGLFGLLAAVLIGSFEPSSANTAMPLAGAMLAGVAYGFLLVRTVALDVQVPARAVHSQTALGYAVVLSVLVLVAWLVGRVTGLPHAWWLPLSVVALGEPSLDRSTGRAVARLMAGLLGTLLLLKFIDALELPGARAACAFLLMVALLLQGRRYPWLQGFVLVPLLVAVTPYDSTDLQATLQATLLASVLVFSFAVLGKWMLWTLRPDAGRALA